MALDTIAIYHLTEELSASLSGARIEKVYQPEKDEIVLNIKAEEGSRRLVISANSSHPRIHFTSVHKENPEKAPLFCMLLRKHIQGGKIRSVEQAEYERIIRICVESYDELGDLTQKFLICEIMGRNSNIILTKDDQTIIDSIKHIDLSVSSVRQILPGLEYSSPPAQEKMPVLGHLFDSSKFDFSSEGITADKALMSAVSGISPLCAREIVYDALKSIPLCAGLDEKDIEKIISGTKAVRNLPKKPCMIIEKETGRTIDFSPFDIFQYGNSVKKEYFSSMSELLDEFYKTRDSAERMKQKSADLVHLLKTNIERLSKKIAILNKTLEDAKKKDKHKIYADLLTANIYRIAPKESSVTVENYYSSPVEDISIPLDPSLSPAKNAQRYYKLYQKAKNAETEAAKQLETALGDLSYMESTLVLTSNCRTEQDINAIKNELYELGYIKRKNNPKNQKKQRLQNLSKPHHYISSDGFDIYVGKNNTQNDYLTLRFANSLDMWFHTKKIHGSHTVIKLGINKDIPPQTIKEAASLAAYYSKGRDSSNVPVDYTQIKNVKKPNGAKPGMVIYDHYNTVYIEPKVPQGVTLAK